MLTLLFTCFTIILDTDELPYILTEFSPPPRTITLPVTLTLSSSISPVPTPSPTIKSPVIVMLDNTMPGLLTTTVPFFTATVDVVMIFGAYFINNEANSPRVIFDFEFFLPMMSFLSIFKAFDKTSPM